MPRPRSLQRKSRLTVAHQGASRTPLGPISLAFLCLFSACGGAGGAEVPEQPPPAEPSVAPANTSAEPAPPALPDEDADDGPAVAEEESAATEEDPNAIREVVYQKSTGSLAITVDGVRFKVIATPRRVGGGWGVVVAAEAEVIGEETRYLLSPKGGPLAFHGTVVKLSDKTKPIQKVGDKRDGDEEQLVVPDDSLEFSREWPRASEGEKPLYGDQQLTLEVALWGVGTRSRKTRAVKRFVRVSMVYARGRKPQAFVNPPD